MVGRHGSRSVKAKVGTAAFDQWIQSSATRRIAAIAMFPACGPFDWKATLDERKSSRKSEHQTMLCASLRVTAAAREAAWSGDHGCRAKMTFAAKNVCG